MVKHFFIFSAGVVLGIVVTSVIAGNRMSDDETRYNVGYRDGWFEVAEKLKPYFESRQPAKDETIVDHLSMKTTDLYIVRKDNVITLVYLD